MLYMLLGVVDDCAGRPCDLCYTCLLGVVDDCAGRPCDQSNTCRPNPGTLRCECRAGLSLNSINQCVGKSTEPLGFPQV